DAAEPGTAGRRGARRAVRLRLPAGLRVGRPRPDDRARPPPGGAVRAPGAGGGDRLAGRRGGRAGAHGGGGARV
ncbi:MAG: hypothetical protein AVDCRST_MAG41-873, partial [uncultured Corynebacteriales bacterium]